MLAWSFGLVMTQSSFYNASPPLLRYVSDPLGPFQANTRPNALCTRNGVRGMGDRYNYLMKSLPHGFTRYFQKYI